MNIVKWYGYTVNNDDGQHVMAHNDEQAEQWVNDNCRCHDSDEIDVYPIGTIDADHWESEYMSKAWED